MKYIVLVGDGMADYPISSLGDKTPLEYANIPNMNFIAKNGILGTAETVPPGFPAGSDVANLSIFGYDPAQYYTGRAPLEAASMGIKLSSDEVAFRCNLVTIENNTMKDFTAGHITSEEATRIISLVQKEIGSDNIKFYSGVSYRNLTVIKGDFSKISATPPHDITGKEISTFLPQGENSKVIFDLMKKSVSFLADCEVNKERISKGKSPVTMIWLWGQGKDATYPTLKELFGFEGGVITAVDLLKGIGKKAGLKIINVPGATGYLDTNYIGKANAALEVLEQDNFVFVHVESPDEASHEGSLEKKIKAMEDFDNKVVGTILKGIKKFSNYRIILLPDHPTPIKLKTHSAEPVPFAMMGTDIKAENFSGFNEKEANKSKYKVKGKDLLKILSGKIILK